jgi:hypothetical protein
MEIDDRIARAKDLIQKREEINTELAGLFGIGLKQRRRSGAQSAEKKGTTPRPAQLKRGQQTLNDVEGDRLVALCLVTLRLSTTAQVQPAATTR